MTSNNLPLVSIFLSAYNVEAYIEECMNSLVNQTYPNIEIIVIDDCSTDQTYSILQRFAKQDNRVRLFRNEVNLHIPKSLNFALSKVSGEYLLHQDGDDVAALDRVEVMINYLIEHPEIDLLGSSSVIISPEGKEIRRSKFYSNPQLLREILPYRSPVNHIWATRAEVYTKVGGYREGVQGVEDYDFILRVLSAGMTISNLEDYYGYKMRVGRAGNTISSIGVRQKKMHDYVYQLYLERLKTGSDSYTPENFERATSATKGEVWRYNQSVKYLNRAIITKNPLIKIINILGCFISYHQVKYLYYAWQYRRITSKY